jgi:hypothetical protein
MRNSTFGIIVWLTISCYSDEAQPYWVIETNLHQKSFTIVKFYNDQHSLIYEQKQEGVYFDLSKKKHKRRLDSMLKNYLSSGSPISKKEAKRKSSKQF